MFVSWRHLFIWFYSMLLHTQLWILEELHSELEWLKKRVPKKNASFQSLGDTNTKQFYTNQRLKVQKENQEQKSHEGWIFTPECCLYKSVQLYRIDSLTWTFSSNLFRSEASWMNWSICLRFQHPVVYFSCYLKLRHFLRNVFLGSHFSDTIRDTKDQQQ